VDFDDGVVDIDQHPPTRLVTSGGDQPGGLPGQAGQEPGGDRVELAHVPEGERAQERAQRRGGVRAGEHSSHPTVAQQGHVIDRVGAGDHPGHQGGDLQPGVGALIRRHTQMLIGQGSQTGRVGQRQHRDQPSRRHQIRVIEHRRHRRGRVRQFHFRP